MSATRSFNGVICFGGSDWWYHNRGHYDMQMCRQLARHVPVLYVNSLGVRVPSLQEGSYFLRRVGRKLRSWSRSFVRFDARFGVVSPISIPGRAGRAACGPILQAQVRRAAARMGMSRPLVWVECPTAEAVLDRIDSAGLVYQRTDRYEEFPGVNVAAIKAHDQRLKAAADLTLFCSTYLFDAESSQCRRARFIDHGVEFDRFSAAAVAATDPADMRGIPRPRVGFVGGIDAHTFDPHLFRDVVARVPQAQFVLVGQCSLPANWCTATNVHMLGRRPYEAVAAYMAACDVLIMPWNQNEWIRACNPVKLKEYLAVGRPIVSTPFEELNRYGDLVRVEGTSEGFAAAIRQCLAGPVDAHRLQECVRSETWAAKAAAVMRELAGAGIQASAVSEAGQEAVAATTEAA